MMKTVIILLTFFTTCSLHADVYKWTDETGTVHYSTKKTNESAEQAELPEIMKGEVKVPKSLLETCMDHGGIDCDAGADEDGSVICRDGYKDAATRYIFNCKAAQLVMTQISELNEDGNYLVYVRNKKGVRAEKVSVKYALSKTNIVDLEGPTTINPFQLAEYKLSGMHFIVDNTTPSSDLIEVSCENCS